MVILGKQMRSAFGLAFLWVVAFVYFTQGFKAFVWTAVSYQLKDVLKLTPSASQFVVSTAFFPWSIKPLYGIISDCIPIKGRKRVPYLIIATVLSLLPWLLLGLISDLRDSEIYLTVLLTLHNLGSAIADVVIDAMVAEAVRLERAAFAGDLQSLSWFSMALGGIFGSLLGGYSLSNLKIGSIFLLFSFFPSIQLVSCLFIEDLPLGSKAVLVPENNNRDHACSEESSEDTDGDMFHKGELTDLVKTSNSSTLTRRVNKKDTEHTPEGNNTSEIVEKRPRSLLVGTLLSLKGAFFSLCHAFRQPAIRRPMMWFFFAHITIPNLSTIMFYYQTEALHLDASFLGNVRVIGWFGLILGTYTYNRFLKRMRLRRILFWAHIGLAILNTFDIILISRKNILFGIPDKYMVICGSALADAVNQFKMMPFLILSGQLCPPGIEGTLFALFMSINNFGSTVSSFLGAALASSLNISSNSFDNLLLGVIIQTVSIFIPIFFLFLIPKSATGLSA